MRGSPVLPPMAPDRARRLVSGFSHTSIFIVGDVMLDEFLIGQVSRISPEAPVPIVSFDHEERRIGGAANVAHNVATLGGTVTLVGVVGQDEPGDYLGRACQQRGIHARLVVDPGRRTTTKVRIVTERNQQVARIDYETDRAIAGDIEGSVVEQVRAGGRLTDVIIVSDYLKGSITARVMQEVASCAVASGTPILVDPKIPHLGYYAGATIVTPNHHEAEAATHVRVCTDDNAHEAAQAFRARAGCAGVLMTRGDQGMWLLDETWEGPLPAAAREVADVTGAGDTVIATLALALAAGGTTVEAARLANQAAGIVVGKFGPSAVTPSELMQALEAPHPESARG